MVARPQHTREIRVCVAQIGAAHGLKGELRLWSFTEDPQAVATYGPLQSEDGARAFRILNARAEKDHLIVRLDGVADRNAAEALRNVRLYVARDKLPATDNETFYHADLIGLAAHDMQGGEIGEVIAVHNFGAGDIIELRKRDGATLMLPFSKAVVPDIDLAAGRMTVDPPVETGDETEERSAEEKSAEEKSARTHEG